MRTKLGNISAAMREWYCFKKHCKIMLEATEELCKDVEDGSILPEKFCFPSGILQEARDTFLRASFGYYKTTKLYELYKGGKFGSTERILANIDRVCRTRVRRNQHRISPLRY